MNLVRPPGDAYTLAIEALAIGRDRSGSRLVWDP